MADWTWNAGHNLYFSPSTNTWARPDPQTGAWSYLPGSGSHTPLGHAAGLATGYQLAPATDGQGGIGNVGWALEADLGDASGREGEGEEGDAGTGGNQDGDRVDGGRSTADDSRRSATNDETNADDPIRQASSEQIISAPHTAAPTAPIAATPKVLRLVLVSSSILPTTPTSPKTAILDSRSTGYYLARDRHAGKPVLRLKEMVVSKCHAMIWYGTREGEDDLDQGRDREKGFWIVDCGSTHGTFLLPPSSPNPTPTRLSPARQSSLPHKLTHLTRLTIGTTTFECHLHPTWPCDTCALHTVPPIPLDDPSTSRSGTPTHPLELPNPAGWNRTEQRAVALTSEAKRADTARRAGLAMRSLKARYFGRDAVAGKGKRG